MEELERLNQLKDDFLSTVSHELRTPMSNMNMALYMMDKAPPERRTTYLEILRSECDREIELINSLLDLQRLEADAFELDIEPIHLADWLPTLLQPFHSRCQQQRQQLRVATVAELPSLQSDAASLKRILAELLNNACKYTPPEGVIHFQVRLPQAVGESIPDSTAVDGHTVTEIDAAIDAEVDAAIATAYKDSTPAVSAINRPTRSTYLPTASLTESNHSAAELSAPSDNSSQHSRVQPVANTVQFVISNQAAISAKELPHIFDKFYRVPNADPWKRGGTGLGLALVKKLVEYLNGSIHVTSNADWTCFIVDIPHHP